MDSHNIVVLSQAFCISEIECFRVAKLKSKRGYRFIKELGGAVRRTTVSNGATWLVDNQLLGSRVLDYGCGFGFDADHFGWEAFDPYYRQQRPTGKFESIVCNHVLNMLTREARHKAIVEMRGLLVAAGAAWIIVPRNIPRIGKIAPRQRIQNYVQLSLPSVFRDSKQEIYKMESTTRFHDRTDEIQWRLGLK